MKTINRLKELGFTCLCPVVVGGEKDKSPETKISGFMIGTINH